MKQRIFLTALAMALLMLMLPGCSGAAIERTAGNVRSAAPAPEAVPTVSGETAPVPEIPVTETPSIRQSDAALTKEQAQAIAFAYLGLEETQVTGLKTEFEIDNGVPQYDVQFHHDRWEYEFEINAQSGQILSVDKDDR